MRVNAARPARVLLVDDDEIDSNLTCATFEAARIAMELQVANSGEAALKHLREADTLPDLVLLDVRMPGINGIETLHALKSEPRWRAIPVIMLSGSAEEEDILRSYAERAHAYLTKPIHVDAFRAIVRRLEGFCFLLAVRPPE